MKEKFGLVEHEIKKAKLVAFDECHKIYLAMDDKSAEMFEKNKYTVVRREPEAMLQIVKKWYRDSCSLRFVSSVRHDEVDPNNGYADLIPQFAE
jgi:hypothetical protein